MVSNVPLIHSRLVDEVEASVERPIRGSIPGQLSTESDRMSTRLNRREFVQATAAAAAAGLSAASEAFGQAPAVATPGVKPLVIASANGNRYKNGGAKACLETAFELVTQGRDVLDAVIAGVTLNELDPADTSVGYGGLPNADGVVQLDASCMHGPKRRAGAVACLEGVRTPAAVARAVMDQTDHHLIVGRDAQEFARQMGFTIEDDLNTDTSRKLWLEWKRRGRPGALPGPRQARRGRRRVGLQMVAEGLIDPEHALRHDQLQRRQRPKGRSAA